MNPETLIDSIRDAGTDIQLHDGQLRLSGSKPDDELLKEVRHSKREIVLHLAMNAPLRPQRKWPHNEVKELSAWLDTRPIDDRVWVSNRALLYDDRDGFAWKSDCYAIKDLQEVVEPESLQIAS